MKDMSRFETVLSLFALLIISSAADWLKIPLNQYVFGAILLALNVNGVAAIAKKDPIEPPK